MGTLWGFLSILVLTGGATASLITYLTLAGGKGRPLGAEDRATMEQLQKDMAELQEDMVGLQEGMAGFQEQLADVVLKVAEDKPPSIKD